MKYKLTLLLAFTALSVCSSQIKYQLPEVIVTAARTEISSSDLTRNIFIISKEDIKRMPVNSLQDILQYVAGVDVRQRGVEGVQADVSIRGGTFEQTLIMIDGIKLSDPQTGHHNLNLPVTPENIERIEVLKGQGSKSFGANAFSGVINFITKKESARKIFIQAAGGQNGYYDGVLNTAYSIGKMNNSLSLSRKKSDGYRHNTDFEALNFSYNSSLNFGSSKLNFLFGFNDKEFGANGFYSDRFPNQWEHTTTKLAGLRGEYNAESFSIYPKLYWRRNDDRFLLDFTNPSFYENIHQTNIFGFELQASVKTDLGVTSFGGEYIQDEIESTNLSNHSRTSKGIFAEQKIFLFEKLTIVAGAFIYDYPTIGLRFWPGFDFSYNLIPNLRFYGSTGKAFRVPTYTDLFYSDQASQGNPELKHEETLNYEAGVNFAQPIFSINLNVFRKEGKNIIDWFRRSAQEKWVARNIAEINTNGIEVSANFYPTLLSDITQFSFGINYIYLDIDKELDETASRYALDHLKQQLVVNINYVLPFSLSHVLMLRYEDRINLGNHFLVDTQLNYNIDFINVFLKVTNLFNKSYQDMNNLPLPGRWIIAGTNLGFDI